MGATYGVSGVCTSGIGREQAFIRGKSVGLFDSRGRLLTALLDLFTCIIIMSDQCHWFQKAPEAWDRLANILGLAEDGTYSGTVRVASGAGRC